MGRTRGPAEVASRPDANVKRRRSVEEIFFVMLHHVGTVMFTFFSLFFFFFEQHKNKMMCPSPGMRNTYSERL